MGAEAQQDLSLPENDSGQVEGQGQRRPLILGLQPSALVDHVARVDWSLLNQIPGDRGGSKPFLSGLEDDHSFSGVAIQDLEYILSEVNTHILPLPDDTSPIRTMAGGSVANTIRGLSAGFGISCGLIGAYGDDEQGQLFVRNMGFNGVDLSRLRMKRGHTAQCACLVDADGNRTMRPCLSNAVRLQPDELSNEDFRGSKWLAVRYAFNNLDLIHAAVGIAKKEGVFVSLDLASFEMVRNFRLPLLGLLESGNIDLCFANEDEARELLRGKNFEINDSNMCKEIDGQGEPNADPEAALRFLGRHCQWAVVTLGPKGCVAKHGEQVVRVPAVAEAKATDATGAGDLFAGGFLYGLVKGLSLEDCCKVGSCSGGAVVQSLGGEVRLENWRWMYKQMKIKGLLVPDLHPVSSKPIMS